MNVLNLCPYEINYGSLHIEPHFDVNFCTERTQYPLQTIRDFQSKAEYIVSEAHYLGSKLVFIPFTRLGKMLKEELEQHERDFDLVFYGGTWVESSMLPRTGHTFNPHWHRSFPRDLKYYMR